MNDMKQLQELEMSKNSILSTSEDPLDRNRELARSSEIQTLFGYILSERSTNQESSLGRAAKSSDHHISSVRILIEQPSIFCTSS